MERNCLLAVLALLATLVPAIAHAQFTGTLEFKPAGCEKTGICRLKYDLKFKDPRGIEWQADAEDQTDGASIPLWAQPFIGQPFDPRFTKAAVIHDHYCDRHVRPWRDTHRVFFEGLLATGLDEVLAKTMYFGVYLGGPRWTTLIKGKPCGSQVCVNAVPEITLRYQEDSYDAPDFAVDLKEANGRIMANPDISLEELEHLAQSKRPNDYFYKVGDTVVVEPGSLDSILMEPYFKDKYDLPSLKGSDVK